METGRGEWRGGKAETIWGLWSKYQAMRGKRAGAMQHQAEQTGCAAQNQCRRHALPLPRKPLLDAAPCLPAEGNRTPFLRDKVRRAELFQRLFGRQGGRVPALAVCLHERAQMLRDLLPQFLPRRVGQGVEKRAAHAVEIVLDGLLKPALFRHVQGRRWHGSVLRRSVDGINRLWFRFRMKMLHDDLP